jgi:hypothetical protein
MQSPQFQVSTSFRAMVRIHTTNIDNIRREEDLKDKLF